jgi:TRAP-type C4-dicarboxylate transport system permease small subunit
MGGKSGALAAAGARAGACSAWLDRAVERICVALAVLLVLDVWLGVLVRYAIPLPITFMEEAARYLMIWMALLAVSCGISRREHIGVELVFDRFPAGVRRTLLALLDLLAFAFFALLLFYGLGMVDKGARQLTMIYGLSKALPFAAVPVAAALACVQLALVAVRDQARFGDDPDAIEPGRAMT